MRLFNSLQCLYTLFIFIISTDLLLVRAEKQCARFSRSTCLFGEVDSAHALCDPVPCKFDHEKVGKATANYSALN